MCIMTVLRQITHMTSVSFSSGELLDIIKSLEVMETKADFNEDYCLASYYLHLIQQFERIHDKLQEMPGEKRVAHLILAQA